MLEDDGATVEMQIQSSVNSYSVEVWGQVRSRISHTRFTQPNAKNQHIPLSDACGKKTNKY